MDIVHVVRLLFFGCREFKNNVEKRLLYGVTWILLRKNHLGVNSFSNKLYIF